MNHDPDYVTAGASLSIRHLFHLFTESTCIESLSLKMAGMAVPIEGDQKKRVVSCESPNVYIVAQSCGRQCYFFDSDVGGFHYGPGHP